MTEPSVTVMIIVSYL